MNIQDIKTQAASILSIVKKDAVIIVMTAAVVALILYIVMPAKEKIVPHTIVQAVRDDAEINKLAQEKQNILDEKEGLLSRIFRLEHPAQVTGGSVGNATPDVVIPATENELQTISQDTSGVINKDKPVYNEDFVVSGSADKSHINFFTFNPALKLLGKPPYKTYVFDRQTSDFEFATQTPTGTDQLDGIKLNYEERMLSFDGAHIGVGSLFPTRPYVFLDADFSAYEKAKFSIRATSFPALDLSAKWRIF